tara:strand:- start:1836 stop:2054 length:219 start_codon:yes stop_codon:yes gene_type:complete
MLYRDLILEILKEIESKDTIIKVRGVKGYGASHPYVEKEITPGYGQVDIETKKEKPKKKRLVKVSRAFKKGR